MKPRILFFVTEDWYFCSHRLELARAAAQSGFDVSVLTRVRDHGSVIEAEGFNLIPLNIRRRGINPLAEIDTIRRVAAIYRRERPRIVHHIAMKPVLYGSMASLLAGSPAAVNTLPGLGYIFSSDHLRARALRPVVTRALSHMLNRPGSMVIVQNPENRDFICSGGIQSRDRTHLIKGSGVDTSTYSPRPFPAGMPVITLASRMLWAKGPGDFAQAARMLRNDGVRARFVLAGDTDLENRAAVPRRQLEDWNREGAVEWSGHRDDMPDLFAGSHVVCLPSVYSEGVPKVLIEAAACGRPIVTTDTPGCREIVRQGENGFLTAPGDSEALAAALRRLIEDEELRRKMGRRSREIALSGFSLQHVISQTLSVYQELL